MADDAISAALSAQVYGLVVVGSVSGAGEPNGMTANWITQVSFDPRIVAVAIQSDAHTRRNIDETGVFSVSVLPVVPQDLVLKFTRRSTSGEGRLEGESSRAERRCSTRPSRGTNAAWWARRSPATTSSTSARSPGALPAREGASRPHSPRSECYAG